MGNFEMHLHTVNHISRKACQHLAGLQTTNRGMGKGRGLPNRRDAMP